MATTAERTVRLSVLDRLRERRDPEIDDERFGPDAVESWSESVRRLKRALLRDMRELLNTRRIHQTAPDRYPEVQHSVYHYGLPDITSMSLDPDTVRHRLTAYIEESIALFEPRLTAVRVTPVEVEGEDRTVRFTIEGLLRMDPNPERIVFDTVLETASGDFQVTGDPYA